MARPAQAICSVGAGAGFAGDRIDPALDLVRSGLIDTMALECLAERTELKATLGYRDGWIGEGQISYAGPGAHERGTLQRCSSPTHGAENYAEISPALTALRYRGQRHTCPTTST